MQEHINPEIIASIKSQIEIIQATYEKEKAAKYKLIATQYAHLKHQLFKDLFYALVEMQPFPVEHSVYLLRQLQQKFDIQTEFEINKIMKQTQISKFIQHFLLQFVLNPLFVIQPDSEKKAADWAASLL